MEIRPGVDSVGAVDWDRRLFDALIPLPHGTSYNAYLVRGSEKTALLDTVDPAMTGVLLGHLKEQNVSRLDYVIAHHAEQDHSGSLPAVLQEYPTAQVICSPKCKAMLMDLLGVAEEKIRTVNDQETISLGDRALQFWHTPWVHWPETMCSYLTPEKILFSCDFFGSHLATSHFYAEENSRLEESAKRYYAEIMMPFHTNIEKNLEKLEGADIKWIAPSHGPIHRKPEVIVNLYRSWVSGELKNKVVVPYVSMHGSTQMLVNVLVEELVKRKVEVKRFDLPATDLGELAMELVDAATIVIGTPTVLSGPHPAAVYAAYLANALRPRLKYASIIGSFLWGSRAVEVLKSMLPNLNAQILEPVIARGRPKEGDYAAVRNLAEMIAAKHKELAKPPNE